MLRATPVICEIRSVSELNKSVPLASIAVVLGAFLFPPVPLQAADFQVVVTQSAVPQCSLTGSMLDIDPASGKVTIDLSTGFSCYPLVVRTLANDASLSVTGSTTVGGGITGMGTVNLQLITGLSAPTPGVTCVPDGITSSNVSVTSDWTAPLCANNCGATATRTVSVQNTSSTVDGYITFKAKCTYQDQSNTNLSSVRANIQSTPSVTVQHGTTPPANYCQNVSELSDSKGLTNGMRQTVGTVTGGTMPGTNISFLDYTSVFGVTANTAPQGSGDTLGLGFPGTNKTAITTYISRDKYISLKFRAPTYAAVWDGRGGSYFFQSQSSVGLSVAIAPCPGQFDSDAFFPLTGFTCKGESLLEAQWLVTNGSTLGCKLEPGKTYYLNLIHAQRSDPTNTYCTGGSCSVQIINRNNY